MVTFTSKNAAKCQVDSSAGAGGKIFQKVSFYIFYLLLCYSSNINVKKLLTLTALNDIMTGHDGLHQGAESLVSQLQAGQAALVALLGEDPVRQVAEHPPPRSTWNKGVLKSSGAGGIGCLFFFTEK